MPTKRHRVQRARNDGDHELQAFHAESGDCLLAGADGGCLCGLRLPSGEEDLPTVNAIRRRLGLPDVED